MVSTEKCLNWDYFGDAALGLQTDDSIDHRNIRELWNKFVNVCHFKPPQNNAEKDIMVKNYNIFNNILNNFVILYWK